jgi:hypothetical protein
MLEATVSAHRRNVSLELPVTPMFVVRNKYIMMLLVVDGGGCVGGWWRVCGWMLAGVWLGGNGNIES